jgi:hypothetical protein
MRKILIKETYKMNDASTIPKDGSRILVKYKLKRSGEKWEECRWINASEWDVAEFEPWCGSLGSRTTRGFGEDRVLGWLPLPDKGE